MLSRRPRPHPSIPRKHGFGDGIMLSAHDLTAPWYGIPEQSSRDRLVFNMDFRAPRGVIRIPPKAAAWAEARTASFGRFVLVEPHVKGTFSSTNKRWPFAYWQQVARHARIRLVQCVNSNKPVLEGALLVKTPSFWHAVAILSRAEGFIGTDSGLHHAAAALRKRAIVIWGAYSPPEVLGYDDHINLASPDPRGLGQRNPCSFCEAAMRRIRPELVLEQMARLGWSDPVTQEDPVNV